MTLALSTVSRLRCWIGERLASNTTSCASSCVTRIASSSAWPLPISMAAPRLTHAQRHLVGDDEADRGGEACGFRQPRVGVAQRVPLIGKHHERASAARELILVPIEAGGGQPSSGLRRLFGEVERPRRLDRRDGVLVDQLGHALARQQHAEQIEAGDIALQHDPVDQEHRHAVVGLAHGVEENVLQQGLGGQFPAAGPTSASISTWPAGMIVEIACL